MILRLKNLPLNQKTVIPAVNQGNSISGLNVQLYFLDYIRTSSENFLMAQKLLRYLQLSHKLILVLSRRFALFNNVESEIFEPDVTIFINH